VLYQRFDIDVHWSLSREFQVLAGFIYVWRYDVVSHRITSYHIIDLKRQNRLRVGTDKPKLKVKMRSVSDDEKTSWKATFWAGGKRYIQTGKMLFLRQGVSGLWAMSQPAAVWSLAVTHYFCSEYYQVLIATHLPTTEGWKVELASVPTVSIYSTAVLLTGGPVAIEPATSEWLVRVLTTTPLSHQIVICEMCCEQSNLWHYRWNI